MDLVSSAVEDSVAKFEQFQAAQVEILENLQRGCQALNDKYDELDQKSSDAVQSLSDLTNELKEIQESDGREGGLGFVKRCKHDAP